MSQRTNIESMVIVTQDMLTKISIVFMKLGMRWDPRVSRLNNSVMFELADGVSWSPNRGLVMYKHVSSELLYQALLREHIQPVVI